MRRWDRQTGEEGDYEMRRDTVRFDLSSIVIAGLLIPTLAPAQADHANHAVHEAMAGAMAESPHMRMTAARPQTVADSVRAIAIADTLRMVLARYANPAAAEAQGYTLFLPNVKNQKVFHYTNWKNALQEAFRFDPTAPTSILYKKDTRGRVVLVGAMYTMPRGASVEDLDRRVPVSVARWHLHTNLCVPRKGAESRYSELQHGKPLFGLNGSIVSKEACDAENGRFLSKVFGWMVHANVFAGTDLASVWAH